jgi:hypothetical protein
MLLDALDKTVSDSLERIQAATDIMLLIVTYPQLVKGANDRFHIVVYQKAAELIMDAQKEKRLVTPCADEPINESEWKHKLNHTKRHIMWNTLECLCNAVLKQKDQ